MDLLYTAMHVVANPLLPAGKGGIILVMGGLAMLAFALVWLGVVAGQPSPVAHAHPGRRPARRRGGPVLFRPATAGQATAGRSWTVRLEREAGRFGLGRPHVARVEGGRCLLVLRGCRSCRRRGHGACEYERHQLERIAQDMAPRAEVREVGCDQDGGRTCSFEVRLGGRP